MQTFTVIKVKVTTLIILFFSAEQRTLKFAEITNNYEITIKFAEITNNYTTC